MICNQSGRHWPVFDFIRESMSKIELPVDAHLPISLHGLGAFPVPAIAISILNFGPVTILRNIHSKLFLSFLKNIHNNRKNQREDRTLSSSSCMYCCISIENNTQHYIRYIVFKRIVKLLIQNVLM